MTGPRAHPAGADRGLADVPLFADGTEGERVDAFRRRVRRLVTERLTPLVAAAERDRRFPRSAIEALGSAGLFRERWAGGGHGDLGRAVVLAEELGRAGLGGVGVGASLHLEAATGVLVRFARNDHTRAVRDGALAGRAVLCVAASEQHAGSDLSAVRTRLERNRSGWTVRGTKWFVSPGARADAALVLCRHDDGPALVVVPRAGLHVVRTLRTTGLRSLETVRLRVDAEVPDEAVLARPGLGLQAVTWGLTHERLALAAQLAGGMDLALALAATRLHRREQFGMPLVRHQALRLRLAELAANALLLRHGVESMAWSLGRGGSVTMRDVAGAKAVAARLAERVLGECAHLFGGAGYLEDETPFSRLRRDLQVGRLGAGSDEMMWELVAGGLPRDDDRYDTWIAE
jgi:acyl-ACP dehydrogenase